MFLYRRLFNQRGRGVPDLKRNKTTGGANAIFFLFKFCAGISDFTKQKNVLNLTRK